MFFSSEQQAKQHPKILYIKKHVERQNMDRKDEVKTKEIFECSARNVKSENETIEDHYMETIVKLENSVNSTKLDTDIKSSSQNNLKHMEYQTFSCSVCSISLKSKKSLLRHERIHTGSQLFYCSVCNKAFTQKTDRTRHERIHTGSRPFSCSVCNKSYTAKSNLVKHEKIHTESRPFSCSVCNKSFANEENLLQHKVKHTGLRSFSCSVCNKSFTQKKILLRHEKIHIGLRPYSLGATGTPPSPPLGILCHYDFLIV